VRGCFVTSAQRDWRLYLAGDDRSMHVPETRAAGALVVPFYKRYRYRLDDVRIIADGSHNRHSGSMKLFWTCFSIDALVFAVVFYFFLDGLGDRTVSSFNIGIWLALVGIPALVLGGGLYLKRIERVGIGTALLAIGALPGVLAGGWMLLMVVLFALNPGTVH
jgi:hypothetical protein